MMKRKMFLMSGVIILCLLSLTAITFAEEDGGSETSHINVLSLSQIDELISENSVISVGSSAADSEESEGSNGVNPVEDKVAILSLNTVKEVSASDSTISIGGLSVR